LGYSCISIFLKELEAYKTAKTTEVKFSVLSSFEEKIQIGLPESFKILKNYEVFFAGFLNGGDFQNDGDIQNGFNMVFDHNSVSFEHFCILFFGLVF
jgi:hypothetical protein